MSRSTLTALVVVAILAVGIGGYLAYDTFLRGDAVPALGLPSSSPEAGASTEPSSEPSAAASDTTQPSASADSGSGELAGTWTVAAAEAGYRVREQLASLPAESDAVGRTDAVTGSITLAGAEDAIQLTEGSTVVSAWVSLIRIAPAYPASPLLSSLGVVCGEERPNEVRRLRGPAAAGRVVIDFRCRPAARLCRRRQ